MVCINSVDYQFQIEYDDRAKATPIKAVKTAAPPKPQQDDDGDIDVDIDAI